MLAETLFTLTSSVTVALQVMVSEMLLGLTVQLRLVIAIELLSVTMKFVRSLLFSLKEVSFAMKSTEKFPGFKGVVNEALYRLMLEVFWRSSCSSVPLG